MQPSSFLFPLVLATPAAAATWIVDDDGGPGVDFTDIQSAVDAASGGDLVLVLGGDYGPFTLDKALVVLGAAGQDVNVLPGAGTIRVENVQAGVAAALVELDTFTSIWVEDCTIPVIIDSCSGFSQDAASNVVVFDSTDVRIRDSQFLNLISSSGPFGLGNASRVEYVDSSAYGAPGIDGGCPYAGDGHSGIRVGAGAKAHVYRSVVVGGPGGSTHDPYNCEDGQPGRGIRVEDGGFVLHAADAPGQSTNVVVEPTGVARLSDTYTVASGLPGATIEYPVPEDPTLETLAPVAPGQVLTFRAHTVPGAVVDLNLGRFGVVQSSPGTAEDILITTLRTFPLGTVGANGVAGFNFTVPGYLSQGFVFFAQARVTLPGGETRFTNSVPVVLR